MKASCLILCCLVAMGISFALPTPGLTQSIIEIQVVVSGKAAQPLTMAKPQAQFAVNRGPAEQELTFEPPPVPREPEYARSAVYTQVSPGTSGAPRVEVGNGITVSIVTDATITSAPGSARPLILVLTIPPSISGEVSIQLPATVQASQRQILTSRPSPGLRIADSPE